MTGVSEEKNKYVNMLSAIWKPLSPPFTCHLTRQGEYCLPTDHLHSPLKINMDSCLLSKKGILYSLFFDYPFAMSFKDT